MRLALLLFVLLLSSCASNKNDVRAHANGNASTTKLTSFAQSLLGTRYKYGGNSPATGFDCSGFVDYVFQRSADVSLPRSAQQISQHGASVKSYQLREGDLVFFDTNNESYSHVGIYLGDGRFIHAPSNGGRVRIEDMSMDYWKKHYNGARRITLRN
jgi:cell wall-associated NlpC family hydrolase